MSDVTDYWAAGRISSNFGDARPNGRKHRGTDYTHGNGVAIPSPLAGTVVGTLAPDPRHGFGYQVTVRAASGETYSFAHMQSDSRYGVGAVVAVGDILGLEGRTGATTGPCVHVEYNNGGFSNPAPHVAGLLLGGTTVASSGGFNQDTKNRQAWLLALGISVGASGADGIEGSATRAGYKVYQADLKAHWGYAGKIDGVWGSGTAAAHQRKADAMQAPAPAPAPAAPAAPAYPTVNLSNIASIGDVRGLQKIAKLNGGKTTPDNQWGGESQKGLQNFLNRNYGGSLVSWLRQRWGYVGNDQLGPVMTAALQRANAVNFKELRV